MIDQISRALPEMTWLTERKQDGYDVTMQGRCLTLTALSDFIGNLEGVALLHPAGRDHRQHVSPAQEGPS